MIALNKERTSPSHDSVQEQFQTMLPQVHRQANVAFRRLDVDSRDELIAEVIANAYCAFVRLAERGKAEIAYAVPLANFAIRQVLDGRRVGNKLNIHDVTSPYAQRRSGIRIKRIDRCNVGGDGWREIVVEDKNAGPDVVASTRIDFGDWLCSLSGKTRQIAATLATGETTGETAQQFNVSPGRISQLRRELMGSWEEFTADTTRIPCSV